MTPSRHISVSIAAPAAAAYAYAADPAHLPEWAAGLAQSTVEQVDGHWVAESPMGRVRVEFAPANDLGVLDHTVTLPSGEQVVNPLRVIPDGEGCEVVFTVRQRAGLSAEDFEGDRRAVLADLETLRSLLEHGWARGLVVAGTFCARCPPGPPTPSLVGGAAARRGGVRLVRPHAVPDVDGEWDGQASSAPMGSNRYSRTGRGSAAGTLTTARCPPARAADPCDRPGP